IASRDAQLPGKLGGDAVRAIIILVVDEHVYQRGERWVMHRSSEDNFTPVELFVVLVLRAHQRVMLRVICLNDHSAGTITSSRAARYLSEQLKSPLGSAKIRQRQPDVHRDDTYEGHVVKVVALGNHLSAHQQVDPAARKFHQYLFEASAPSGRVTVEPC